MDNFELSRRNTFAGIGLDRAAEHRNDPEWVAARLTDANTRLVPLLRSRCLVRESGSAAAAVTLAPEAELLQANAPTLLGIGAGHAWFSVSLDEATARTIESREQARFVGLRHAAAVLDRHSAGLLAYAKAMHYWQHRHRFCGVCGHRNRLVEAGHRAECTNPDCARHTFPRIDPAIIVLVDDGERCLLGRQPQWPRGRYSAIAGYVEPGESLEEAVTREVAEETGIRIATASYHSSQPWPFPGTTMLGFHASAADTTIRVGEELEDARWWPIDELTSAVASGELLLPFEYSIAYRLIADWYRRTAGAEIVS